MAESKVYRMLFSKVYPLYIAKAEKKGRTKNEVDQIIYWLTGYDEYSLQQMLTDDADLERFFESAPNFNPKASLIKGSICGIRIENIYDKIMYRIRCLDKLIDELAKGKSMDKILRK